MVDEKSSEDHTKHWAQVVEKLVKHMREWYNGYLISTYDGPRKVYNSFAVMSYLKPFYKNCPKESIEIQGGPGTPTKAASMVHSFSPSKL
eukprot:CAMPEP_0115027782 /NCGR_PEP_ID=MMETSP0216-20121206/35801_1 /TAXON_ID=223996 /ORGANISM="Protocruzia adherens, Strain Boccale" /LENGTH=89 /DNA_ID=CAMNT_0002403623 /DNA_START=30 /DNA_END=296 /DNA_ORIENTATION=-